MTAAHIARLMTFAQHGQPKGYAASDMMRADLEALILAASEARVEPVVGPLSGARSDLPPPPPAASLPVSAPAGQEDARDAKRYRWLKDRIWDVTNNEIGRNQYNARWSVFFYEDYGVAEDEDNLDRAIDAAMSATTEPKP